MVSDRPVRTAVLPAAGLGSRIADHHVDGCKELIEIGGLSMLERTVNEVRKAGIARIIVVSSPTKTALTDAADALGCEVVLQASPAGLLDAVRCADLSEDVLIALPDVLLPDLNVSRALLEAYRGEALLATVVATAPWAAWLSDTGRVLEREGERILAFADKDRDARFPLGAERIVGRYIWTREMLESPIEDELDLLRSLPILIGLPVKTEYVDVGLPEGYGYAQTVFNR